jgi:hypothetical protein
MSTAGAIARECRESDICPEISMESTLKNWQIVEIISFCLMTPLQIM